MSDWYETPDAEAGWIPGTVSGGGILYKAFGKVSFYRKGAKTQIYKIFCRGIEVCAQVLTREQRTLSYLRLCIAAVLTRTLWLPEEPEVG